MKSRLVGWMPYILFGCCCFLLFILPLWNKAIIPARFICGAAAVGCCCIFTSLREKVLKRPSFWAMVGYVFVVFISAFINDVPIKSAMTSAAWFFVFLSFLCLGTLFHEKVAISFFLLGIALAVMLGSYLILGNDGLGIVNVDAFQVSGDRLVGKFQEKGNRLAMLLAVSSFFTLCGAFRTPSKKYRIASLLLVGTLTLLLLNTATRTWFVAYFVTVCLILVSYGVSWKLLALGSVVLVGIIGVLIALDVPQVQLYLALLKNPLTNHSLLSRIPMWQEAWRIFLDHPLFGAGPEQFRVLYAAHYDAVLSSLNDAERLYAIPRTTHAHNYFFHLLAESGVLGLVTLTFVVVSSIVAGVRKMGVTRDAALGLFMIWFVSMVNPAFGREPGTLFMAVMGLAASGALVSSSAQVQGHFFSRAKR